MAQQINLAKEMEKQELEKAKVISQQEPETAAPQETERQRQAREAAAQQVAELQARKAQAQQTMKLGTRAISNYAKPSSSVRKQATAMRAKLQQEIAAIDRRIDAIQSAAAPVTFAETLDAETIRGVRESSSPRPSDPTAGMSGADAAQHYAKQSGGSIVSADQTTLAQMTEPERQQVVANMAQWKDAESVFAKFEGGQVTNFLHGGNITMPSKETTHYVLNLTEGGRRQGATSDYFVNLGYDETARYSLVDESGKTIVDDLTAGQLKEYEKAFALEAGISELKRESAAKARIKNIDARQDMIRFLQRAKAEGLNYISIMKDGKVLQNVPTKRAWAEIKKAPEGADVVARRINNVLGVPIVDESGMVTGVAGSLESIGKQASTYGPRQTEPILNQTRIEVPDIGLTIEDESGRRTGIAGSLGMIGESFPKVKTQTEQVGDDLVSASLGMAGGERGRGMWEGGVLPMAAMFAQPRPIISDIIGHTDTTKEALKAGQGLIDNVIKPGKHTLSESMSQLIQGQPLMGSGEGVEYDVGSLAFDALTLGVGVKKVPGVSLTPVKVPGISATGKSLTIVGKPVLSFAEGKIMIGKPKFTQEITITPTTPKQQLRGVKLAADSSKLEQQVFTDIETLKLVKGLPDSEIKKAENILEIIKLGSKSKDKLQTQTLGAQPYEAIQPVETPSLVKSFSKQQGQIRDPLGPIEGSTSQNPYLLPGYVVKSGDFDFNMKNFLSATRAAKTTAADIVAAANRRFYPKIDSKGQTAHVNLEQTGKKTEKVGEFLSPESLDEFGIDATIKGDTLFGMKIPGKTERLADDAIDVYGLQRQFLKKGESLFSIQTDAEGILRLGPFAPRALKDTSHFYGIADTKAVNLLYQGKTQEALELGRRLQQFKKDFPDIDIETYYRTKGAGVPKDTDTFTPTESLAQKIVGSPAVRETAEAAPGLIVSPRASMFQQKRTGKSTVDDDLVSSIYGQRAKSSAAQSRASARYDSVSNYVADRISAGYRGVSAGSPKSTPSVGSPGIIDPSVIYGSPKSPGSTSPKSTGYSPKDMRSIVYGSPASPGRSTGSPRSTTSPKSTGSPRSTGSPKSTGSPRASVSSQLERSVYRESRVKRAGAPIPIRATGSEGKPGKKKPREDFFGSTHEAEVLGLRKIVKTGRDFTYGDEKVARALVEDIALTSKGRARFVKSRGGSILVKKKPLRETPKKKKGVVKSIW